jgi:muramidase (phage lysozyme)
VHHTSGGDSPQSIVEDWRKNRPGIGTQYIMDRDGRVYDVEKDFGYKGAGQVHPRHTPKQFLDKGIVNANIRGMEIMAKNDKDVTPAQAKAFAQFMQAKYPKVDIYGHGELNPGHREADEGQTAKKAALALRTGDPVAPGSYGPSGVAAEAAAAGAAANAKISPPADQSAVQRAFLRTIAKGEAPEGAYDYIIGGGRAKDLSAHPKTVGSAGKYGSSDAAGQYQFLGSTWDEQAKKYGYKDFKPATQDTAAWNYARDVYEQKTGRKLDADLASTDPNMLNSISKALGQTWTSLPGGTQPNSNWAGKDFASVYGENLKSLSAAKTEYPDPTPGVGAGSSAYDSSDPSAPIGGGGASAVASAAPGAADPAKPVNYGKEIGDAFSDMGKLFSEGPVARNAARPSGPANLPLQSMPTPMPMVPTVDPKAAEMQRQQLALAMQRLNSGKLV